MFSVVNACPPALTGARGSDRHKCSHWRQFRTPPGSATGSQSSLTLSWPSPLSHGALTAFGWVPGAAPPASFPFCNPLSPPYIWRLCTSQLSPPTTASQVPESSSAVTPRPVPALPKGTSSIPGLHGCERARFGAVGTTLTKCSHREAAEERDPDSEDNRKGTRAEQGTGKLGSVSSSSLSLTFTEKPPGTPLVFVGTDRWHRLGPQR